jgi:predicted nuclease of restriction endonuclease-like RecB superfamily
VQYEYETERIPYILARNYIPDFIVQTKTKKIYIETKGYLRPEDKSKLKAVKKLHPDIDLRLVFYEYKLQSVRWATKNKIPYAIGSVPEEWLNE